MFGSVCRRRSYKAPASPRAFCLAVDRPRHGGGSPAERAAIARISRLRWPSGTPIFSTSASVRSGRTSASISCSRNRASYCPRPIAFSHSADVHRRSRTRFDSHDGPLGTASALTHTDGAGGGVASPCASGHKPRSSDGGNAFVTVAGKSFERVCALVQVSSIRRPLWVR